jgi:hypothetical protein
MPMQRLSPDHRWVFSGSEVDCLSVLASATQMDTRE